VFARHNVTDVLRSERRDVGWAAMAILVVVVFAIGALGAVWDLVAKGNWLRALLLPVAAVPLWWWGMGAWRRTRWGRPDQQTPRTSQPAPGIR